MLGSKKPKIQLILSYPDAWMLTFTDLVTLMLTFFVLLFSMGSLDREKAQALFETDSMLEDNTGISPAENADALKPATQDMASYDPPAQVQEVYGNADSDLNQQVLRMVRNKALSDRLRVSRDGKDLVIRVADRLRFPVGSERIPPEMLPVIRLVAEMLDARADLSLRTEVFCPPEEADRPDRWELQARRAAALTRQAQADTRTDPTLSLMAYAPPDEPPSSEGEPVRFTLKLTEPIRR